MAAVSEDDGDLGCHTYVPPRAEGCPIVLVHGARRNASALLLSFASAAADSRRMLIAPEFVTPQYKGFQRLVGDGGPLAAAASLRSAVAECAAALRIPEHRFDLVGVSGGAQFAHRYAMVFPHDVRKLILVAAGWYTRVDPVLPFPVGAGPSRLTDGKEIDVESFLRIPLRVIVGQYDVARGAALRKTSELDQDQGLSRLARAETWVEHVQWEAVVRGLPPADRLRVLPGVGHSFRSGGARRQLRDRVFEFLTDARLPIAPSL